MVTSFNYSDVLQKIDEHWAVRVVGNKLLRQSIIQSVDSTDTYDQLIKNNPKCDIDILRRLEMAYKIVIMENMKDFINADGNVLSKKMFVVCSTRVFNINKILNTVIVQEDDLHFIFRLLHLSSLAYCGKSYVGLENMYKKYSTKITRIANKNQSRWDNRILFALFSCWINIFKYSLVKVCPNVNTENTENTELMESVKNIPQIIDQLRKEQEQCEKAFLDSDMGIQYRSKAMRLVTYHGIRPVAFERKSQGYQITNRR